MRFVLAPFRLILVFSSIFIFMAHMAVIFVFVRDKWKRTRSSNFILSRYARLGLFLFNVRVSVLGQEHLPADRGALYVGNHLGYLDVLVLSAKTPACFVTSVEIKNSPFLGQICTMAGCMFVERRNKNNIHNELSELRQGLGMGLNVVIFPEATSTNGEQVLRFRRPLFMSAIDAGAPVLPFCLNYRRIGGAALTLKNRDRVFWYGDMAFLPSIWNLSSSGGVEVDLHYLPMLTTSPELDSTDLAERSQRAVESVFRPVQNI